MFKNKLCIDFLKSTVSATTQKIDSLKTLERFLNLSSKVNVGGVKEFWLLLTSIADEACHLLHWWRICSEFIWANFQASWLIISRIFEDQVWPESHILFDKIISSLKIFQSTIVLIKHWVNIHFMFCLNTLLELMSLFSDMCMPTWGRWTQVKGG